MTKEPTPPKRERPPRGARLFALRRKAGMTQEDAAAEFETSHGHISNIENGRDDPSRELLLRMASFYHVTMDYLETGAGGASVQLPRNAEEDREGAELLQNWARLNQNQRDTVARVIRSYLVDKSALAHDDAPQSDRGKTLSQ